MKAKIAPTSPKYKEKEKNIENFYSANNLSRIDQPPKKTRSAFYALIISLIIGVIAGFFGGLLFNLLLINYPDSFLLKRLNLNLPLSNQTIIKEENNYQSKLETQRQEIVQNIKPSLVNIFFKKENSSNLFEQVYSESEILGSGVVLTSDGWIITTNSVISDLSKKYSIVEDNKTIYEVTNLLQDTATNFVLLKVDSTDLKPVKFVDPDSLKAGQEEIVLRNDIPVNSFDLVVTNIVNLDYKNSQLIQSSERFSRRIKAEDSLGASFSGAALINYKGEVIGLSTRENENNNIFIPSSYLNNKLISILLKEKEIQRPYLGINYIDLSRTTNVPGTLSQKMTSGALILGDQKSDIQAIIPQSPAETAGLKENDIILSVDDTEINQTSNLTETIQDYSVGENITLKILRKDKEQEVKVTLSKVR